ncbi:MAG: energy-coupling factor ABC transporter ATP-binding protein [Candidatus Helarchaeota archaeon]
MKNENYIIEVENLTYFYPDKTPAIKNVSFNVRKGESIGLIGPNGAGKSTLFLLLMGFLKPQSGTIRIFNQELNKKSKKEIRKRIGMVFQDPNDQLFSPSLWEDVAFGPFNLGYNKEEIAKRVNKALNITDLERYTDKAPHHLSFGEKKRAALATILSMDPEILLLDEPFSNLDPDSYIHLREIILKYKKANLTLIIATHDVDVLPDLVDSCILMNNGQIIRKGELHDILTNHTLLKTHKMRMPVLGQLFFNLKIHNIINTEMFPVTLTEAEKFIESLLKSKDNTRKMSNC